MRAMIWMPRGCRSRTREEFPGEGLVTAFPLPSLDEPPVDVSAERDAGLFMHSMDKRTLAEVADGATKPFGRTREQCQRFRIQVLWPEPGAVELIWCKSFALFGSQAGKPR